MLKSFTQVKRNHFYFNATKENTPKTYKNVSIN